ncbi:hypothetical protein SUGI_0344360 [Cryptomeria japonica]|uniref:transcription factor MYB87 n=1 Tax=Cryptomeria japonica TaxID=3369 RepID=UPI002408CA1C|nr:transcription factor MYB87 [Cryptomeria japonica]GLJ19176.1 hypothetical protein SUGI_0344360 [Cryptomeria japonica]
MKADQKGNGNIHNSRSGKDVLRKGPWMPEEDEILIEYVRQYGARDWNSIGAKGLLPRTGKSCRLRWVNKLKPDLKSGCKFSPEEEKLVMEMQAKLGNKWAKIASYLPGRTDNDVKNFWSTRQKRMMRALQSPKLYSTNAHTVQTHSTDMNKTHYFTDFPVYQQQEQQATAFGGTSFNPTFPDETEDPFQRDQSLEVRRVRQKSQSPFSNELDESLMVKLQDLVAVEPNNLFSDTNIINPGAIALVAEESSEGSAMSSTLNNNDISNNCRSSRLHSKQFRQVGLTCNKREIMSPNTSLVPFDQSENFEHMEDYDQLHELSLTQDSPYDLEAGLFIDVNDSNILDFLLRPEEDATSSVQNSSIVCFNDQQQQQINNKVQIENDFTPSNNNINVHWDKMPLLSPEDIIPISDCAIKQEVDSCTPDSILQVNFPADVFEALEPLSPNASIWWDSEWI